MEELDGDEVILESQSKYYFGVMEIKCRLPLLLNLFYIDPTATKVTGLEIGDISIESLDIAKEQEFQFKQGEKGPFVYSFSILKEYDVKPNIEIIFNGQVSKSYTENGVYSEYAFNSYDKILINNKDTSGSVGTRVILKFGYVIETNFQQIQNSIYSN